MTRAQCPKARDHPQTLAQAYYSSAARGTQASQGRTLSQLPEGSPHEPGLVASNSLVTPEASARRKIGSPHNYTNGPMDYPLPDLMDWPYRMLLQVLVMDGRGTSLHLPRRPLGSATDEYSAQE